MSAIEFLRRHHREVEQLFEQLKVSDDERERLDLLGKVSELLTVHVALEEGHFYPLCRRLGLEDETRRALEEHAQVKRQVSELLQIKRRDPRLVQVLERLQDSVEEHFEQEETDVFPQVQTAADDDELERLGDQMQSEVESLKEHELLKLAESEQTPGA